MDNFSTWTTCSETIEGALANALDAKATWLEAALEEGTNISPGNGAERSRSNIHE